MNRNSNILISLSLLAAGPLVILPAAVKAQVNENITSVRNVNKLDCSASCHQLHGGTSTLLKQVATDLCMSCHDPTIGTDPNAIKVVTHLNGSGNSTYQHKEECLDCHNPHRDLVNRRGRLGHLPEDPPAENVCQDGDSGNNTICRNFKLLGNLQDDVEGAKSSYKPAAFLRIANDTKGTPVLSQSGLGNFSLANATNLNQSDQAWQTNTATAGSWVRADFVPVAGATSYPYGNKEILEVELYVQAAGYSGIYAIEYSDNGTTWSAAFSGFAPALAGVNRARWAQGLGAHRYWRLRLTNTPGSGPWISEVMFYAASDCTATGGTAVFDTNTASPTYNQYLSCKRPIVAGRRTPVSVGGVTYNDWVSTAAPYQGICNTCHTRAQHHRNNSVTNSNDFYYTSPDHSHNDNRNCVDCHDHYSKGFSKNQ